MQLGSIALRAPYAAGSGLLLTNDFSTTLRGLDAYPSRATVYSLANPSIYTTYAISSAGGSQIVLGAALDGPDRAYAPGDLVRFWCDLADVGGGLTYGPGASRPGPGTAGRVYVPSDGVITSIDTGSAWVGWNPGGAVLTIPPAVSSWTPLAGQTGTCADIAGGGIALSVNGTSGLSQAALYRSLGSSTVYSVSCAMRTCCGNAGYPSWGLFVGGASKTLTLGQVSSGNVQITSQTGFLSGSASSVFNFTPLVSPAGLFRWRISADGTTRSYAMSGDGSNWITIYSEPLGTFLTETVAGVMLGAYSGTPENFASTVCSWSGA